MSLADRLATTPGLVQAGVSIWDGHTRLPLHPLSLESAYGDPLLLHDLAEPGAAFARELDVDVIVGAETAGIPLAAAIGLTSDRPFAFVRKPGYRGHVADEPTVRGAAVAGKRVLLVDDGVATGKAVEAFDAELVVAGASVAGVFCLVDMRDVVPTVRPIARTLPMKSVSTYLDVLASATAAGMLEPAVHDLALDAILNSWSDTDPRWEQLAQISSRRMVPHRSMTEEHLKNCGAVRAQRKHMA